MAKKKRGQGGIPTAWEAFAKVSRDAVSASAGGAAKSLRRRAAKRKSGRPPSIVGTTNLGKATAQALKLGRAQAEFVVAERAKARASRAKAVAKRAAKERRGVRKAASKTGAKAGSAKPGPSGQRVLVAEGDSWFDYPFHDVLKELDDAFGWDVEQVAHRGDTVESMAYDGGQLDDFTRAIERVVRRGETPHAILLSGGGNDVAGDTFAMLVDHRNSPAAGLNPAIVDGLLATRLHVAYATILQAVTTTCERLVGHRIPILVHGYDYPVPDGRGFMGGWGFLPGPWLEPGFREKGYDVLGERIAIARDLIDRFYAMLGALVAMPAFSHVQMVDLRGTLSNVLASNRYKEWWANELHPTPRGFTEVARLFDTKL